jgi:hypothetical protein
MVKHYFTYVIIPVQHREVKLEELKAKLSTEIEEADWNLLKKHHENETVFFVSDDLNLVDVAVAVAKDKANFIKVWLDSGQLARPTDDQVKYYESIEYKKMCKFLIIQPYVLVQTIPLEN